MRDLQLMHVSGSYPDVKLNKTKFGYVIWTNNAVDISHSFKTFIQSITWNEITWKKEKNSVTRRSVYTNSRWRIDEDRWDKRSPTLLSLDFLNPLLLWRRRKYKEGQRFPKSLQSLSVCLAAFTVACFCWTICNSVPPLDACVPEKMRLRYRKDASSPHGPRNLQYHKELQECYTKNKHLQMNLTCS